MFGKKRRRQTFEIELWAGDALIDRAPMEEFQFPEDGIIAMSVEFFNDPAPCEIHRAAVRWRALQAMKETSAGERAPVEALESAVRAALPGEASAFRVREIEA